MSQTQERDESTHFIIVDGESALFPKVSELFKTTVTDRYGDQSEALEKISRAADRQCMILVDDKKEPLGILVCKTKPNSEHTNVGLRESLEIKTIRPLMKKTMDFQPFIGKLVRQAEALAKSCKCQSLHVTVSDRDDDMRRLLRECGFRVKYEWPGRYVTGVTEHLMAKSLETSHEEKPSASSTSHSSHSSSRQKKPIDITLMKRYIHHIQSGRKTVEGRVATRMFSGIREGDLVRFFYHHNPTDDVVCEIVEANRYATFREMLEKEGTNKCIPGMDRVDSAVRLYHDLPGYREKESKFGVIGFKLKVVKNKK